MPTIRELPESRSFDADLQHANLDIEFFVDGSDNPLLFGDPRIVEIFVLERVPLVAYRLNRQGPGKYKSLGYGMWLVTVRYGQSIGESPEQQLTAQGPLSATFSGTTSGGTKHINQSLLTRSKSTTDGTAFANGKDAKGNPAPASAIIDNARAIGVSSDSIQGCDIHDRVMQWQIEQPFQIVNQAWIMACNYLTGCVNYFQPFCGFEPGEVVYLGIDFKYGSNDKWNVVHKFECKPNRRNFGIKGGNANGFSAELSNKGGGGLGLDASGSPIPWDGGGDFSPEGVADAENDTGQIMVPFAAGWDYVWCEYVTRAVGSGATKRMLQVPRAVYVEIVYPAGDFSIITGPSAIGGLGDGDDGLIHLGRDAKERVWQAPGAIQVGGDYPDFQTLPPGVQGAAGGWDDPWKTPWNEGWGDRGP